MSRAGTTFQGKLNSQVFTWGVGLLVAALITVCVVIYLMQPARIETVYGHRVGLGQASVNGTAALSGMFESAGHRVFTWRRLSSKLETADTIVWFPDCFKPPQSEERRFLEQWLVGDANRTLIYVGRDYNAAPEYWQMMQGRVAPDQYREYVRREAGALASHNADRAEMPTKEYAGWFTAQRGSYRRKAKNLTSASGWLDGVDTEQTQILLQGDLQIPTDKDVRQQQKQLRSRGSDETVPKRRQNEVLLSSDDTPIISVVRDSRWRGSKIIVVTNGSFLLNLPLVNKEHRKLAGKLINECNPPGQVAFLETDANGATIFESSESSNPNGLEVFTVWPMNAISLHFVAIGIATCFLLWPIFGRPKGEAHEPASDFYKHVVALGNMLERTRDEEFARNRVAHYLQLTHREHPSETGQKLPPSTAAAVPYDLPYEATPENAMQLAQHAADVCTNEYEISLDFTPSSVAQVDQLLTTLHAQNKAADPSSQTLAFCLGVYVGVLLVRHHSGTWHAPSEDPIFAKASPYMIVQLLSIQVTGDQQQMILNPIGKALKQLEMGAPNSIQTFYRETIRQHQADNV